MLIRRSDVPGEIRKKLERVTSSGMRMQRMIEQLLDLTRARLAGGIPVTLRAGPVDLAPVVGKIVDEIRAAHPRSIIEARLGQNCQARIDPDRSSRWYRISSRTQSPTETRGGPSRWCFLRDPKS